MMGPKALFNRRYPNLNPVCRKEGGYWKVFPLTMNECSDIGRGFSPQSAWKDALLTMKLRQEVRP